MARDSAFLPSTLGPQILPSALVPAGSLTAYLRLALKNSSVLGQEATVAS